MSHIIRNKKGFTLAEVITASFIAVYIVIGVWSLYLMAVSWWHETMPKIESQRIARMALTSVIRGSLDSTAGDDLIGSSLYGRRNGIASAVLIPSIPSPEHINFALETDSSNIRAFYLGTDPATGQKAVYYKNNSGQVIMLKSTLGITDLKFEKFDGQDNMVKVTATARKEVLGTRSAAYVAETVYDEVVYLRNMPT